MKQIQIISCPIGSSFEAEADDGITRSYFSTHKCFHCYIIDEDRPCGAKVIRETQGIGILILENEQPQN